jgi:hypothetical protein
MMQSSAKLRKNFIAETAPDLLDARSVERRAVTTV